MYANFRDPQIARILSAVGVKTGKPVNIETAEYIRLSGTYWDGGSRTSYSAVNLATCQSVALPQYNPPQFGGPTEDPLIQLKNGDNYIAIVEYGTFCGKPATVYLHVHPDQMNRLAIQAAPELTEHEAVILIATASLKASYDGRKPRRDAARERGIDDAEFELVSAALKSRGLLNNAGAITTDGRNAVEKHPLRHSIHF